MSKARVAVLISGRGSNMAALIEAAKDPAYPAEIVLVLSNIADAGGLDIAQAAGIETAVIAHAPFGKDREAHERMIDARLRQSGVQIVALAGYMRVLTPYLVETWAGRMINIHPSLLPLYKGLDTHGRAIAAGDRYAGTSVHLVTPELDAGEVLAQVRVPIAPGDTPDSLAERVKFAEHQLYPRAVAEYVGRWRDPAHLLARLRALALALAETDERESHGSPGFRVGGDKSGKYFAYFADQHHGTPHIALLVRTGSMDELLALVEDQPEIYFKPAYYGASGWVGIILNRPGVDWDEVAEWLHRSWRSVAPKRLTRMMDIADEF